MSHSHSRTLALHKARRKTERRPPLRAGRPFHPAMASAAGAAFAAITLLILVPLTAASDSDHKVPVYRTTCPPSPSLAPSKRAHYMRRKTCSPPPWCRASQRQRLARLARSAPHTLDPRSLGVRSACRRPGRVGSLCIARRVELSSGC